MSKMNIFTLLIGTFFIAYCSSGPSRPNNPDISEPDAFSGDGDGTDNNCLDIDGDGHCHNTDCDDKNPKINAGQTEICGNAFDDNCNGEIDENCIRGSIFFIDKDSGSCSDTGPGTQAQPWCTIGKANSTLKAGETVYIRAGTYTGDYIQPANSGASNDARVIYSSYQGEDVIIQGTDYAIRLDSKSYVSVIGIKFEDCTRNLYISSSHHNNIGFCKFDNPGGPSTWRGSQINKGSKHNKIYHCTFSRWGNQDYYGGGYQDYGANLDIGDDNSEDLSEYNLVTNCTFFHGGHHILGVYGSYNVIRHNTFHNEEWYSCHRSDIGGLCGNRNVILNTSLPDKNIRNIIEHNKMFHAGVPPDQVSSAGLSVRTQFNIVRRNAFAFSDSAGVTLSVDSGNHNNASNNHIYHNVFYRNGYLLLDDWNPRKCGLMLARWVDNLAYNPMVGVAIQNNIFFENNLQPIYYYYVQENEQLEANNWKDGIDPMFVKVTKDPDPFDFSALDFHLKPDSQCRNNGGFLTSATNSGQDSTTLVVSDAGYFTDGIGIIGGDLIQLEDQDSTALVIEVDYQSNTITLDKPLSWGVGTGVAQPYSGTQPDQGAYEHYSEEN